MCPKPEFNPRWAANRIRSAPKAVEPSDLDGFVRLGMKRNALRLARALIRKRPVSVIEFNDALNAIMTLADNVRPFLPLADAAYKSLSPRSQAKARFWMLAILSGVPDYPAILNLIPRRFTGEFALLELLYAMEAAFDSENQELIRRLARRLPTFIEQADHPITRAQVLLCTAEFCAREGLWSEALGAAEAARSCETLHKQAVSAIVEIHVAQGLAAVRRGLAEVEEFTRRLDPETETMLPGNDRAVQDQAAREFRRLERALERILPRERQRELRL